MTHRTRRLATVALAPTAALAIWAGARLSGVELQVSAGPGRVGPVDVVAAALLGALGAWLVVRLLERRTRRPERWWPVVGSTALAISIIAPTWLADGADGAVLILMHVVVAVVVIRGFAGTLGVDGSGAFRRVRPSLQRDPAR
jgi:Family of unknown function (DUF6069)